MNNEPAKPHVQILLEDIRAFLLEASLQTHRPSHKRAKELAQQVFNLLGAMKKKRLTDSEVFQDWKPTSDNVRSLPIPIRQHIEECERLIKENEALREQLTLRAGELLIAIGNQANQLEIMEKFSRIQELCK